MTISVISPIYNEEARIEAMLRCASWCDEIVILDKHSTDRTLEIARQYTDKILESPQQEYDPGETRFLLDHVSSEWVILLTASDLIHPQLAAQIRGLVEQEHFPYDVIHVPYRRYVLGVDNPRSPWHGELYPAVFRKNVVRTRTDSVHGVMEFDSDRHYYMRGHAEHVMYHLTHETVDSMMERHLRYCRGESRVFLPEWPLRKGMRSVLGSVWQVVFKRKSFLMGWDGVALGLSFMTYWVLRFVYIWERRCSQAPETYRCIRETIVQAWAEDQAEKR